MNLRSSISLDRVDQKELWSAFKEGDKSAFESIYNLYFQDMYQYGVTLTGDEAHTKDAIQQVFVDLWHSKSRLSHVEKLSAYLIKSLRSKVFKNIKDSKRWSFDRLDDAQVDIEYLQSQEVLVKYGEDQVPDHQNIKLLINNLPPRQREVIMLIFFESKSYEEVANLLAMSIQSVYTLVWRSISNLRKRLSAKD